MNLCHKFIVHKKTIMYFGLKILFFFLDKLNFVSHSCFKAVIKDLLNSILKSSLKVILFLRAWYTVAKMLFRAADKVK